MTIYLSPDVTIRFKRPTRELAGRPSVPLFGLAPDGVFPAGQSPDRWWALTSPFHPYPSIERRSVSVALSVGLPLLGVTQRPARWSSDFPPAKSGRSPGLLDPSTAYNTDSGLSIIRVFATGLLPLSRLFLLYNGQLWNLTNSYRGSFLVKTRYFFHHLNYNANQIP